ncbi:response regulator [Candidatus Saccharibacteria bacterium]|nr:response regulator [Candidatus Saccharibacteria bacterium]
MTKIMVVEDDQSLREIYSIRLTAEGYEVVPAGDGEEALAVAVKEKPDLIISDVMMPKISGFDMLDILRSTPETRDIKVIMMTALSSDDQRKRGEGLGANKYLVKSQVGIEDVIAAVHEVLDGGSSTASGPSATTVAATNQEPVTSPQVAPAPQMSVPVAPTAPVAQPMVAPQPVAQPAFAPQNIVPQSSQPVQPASAPVAPVVQPQVQPQVPQNGQPIQPVGSAQ